jgi:hypothetical protein
VNGAATWQARALTELKGGCGLMWPEFPDRQISPDNALATVL